MESNDLFREYLEPVQPVDPVAPYLGGKRQLAKRLAQLIADIPPQTYAEPFVGMGGVFFRRRSRPAAEVINDRSQEVHALPDAGPLPRLRRLHALEDHNPGGVQSPGRRMQTLTDIQRAAIPVPAALGLRRQGHRADFRRLSGQPRAIRHHHPGPPARGGA